jgi:hypothetical protein
MILFFAVLAFAMLYALAMEAFNGSVLNAQKSEANRGSKSSARKQFSRRAHKHRHKQHIVAPTIPAIPVRGALPSSPRLEHKPSSPRFDVGSGVESQAGGPGPGGSCTKRLSMSGADSESDSNTAAHSRTGSDMILSTSSRVENKPSTMYKRTNSPLSPRSPVMPKMNPLAETLSVANWSKQDIRRMQREIADARVHSLRTVMITPT